MPQERSRAVTLAVRVCIRCVSVGVEVDDVLSALSVMEVGRLGRREMEKAGEKLLDKGQLLFADFPRGGGKVQAAFHYLIDGLPRREATRLRSARTKGLKGSRCNWIQ